MGVDLALLPNPWQGTGGPMLAYERIALDRDYELQALFGGAVGRDGAPLPEVSPRPFGRIVKWYGDGGIESRMDDPYGTPLTFLLPADFKIVLTAINVLGLEVSKRNRAAITFAASLEGDTEIVLWWH